MAKKWQTTINTSSVLEAAQFRAEIDDALLLIGRKLPGFSDVFVASLTEFQLTADVHREAVGRFATALEQRMPDFIRITTIAALLPFVQRGASRHYFSQGASVWDAEDLSAILVQKILAAFFGNWPHGNAGAWIATIRNNVRVDHLRKLRREREKLGNRRSEIDLTVQPDPTEERNELERFICDLPELAQRIIELRCEGWEWQELATTLDVTIDEALAAVQRIDWPGGLSGRKKRRKK